MFVDPLLDEIESITAVEMDLEEIKARDTLKAITIYSNTSFFLYRGEPMGYDYELAQRFAQFLGVELEMIIAEDIDDVIPMLLRGEGDVIAYNLTVTKSRTQYIDFSYPLNFTQQVLVQRKPDNWRDMKLHEIEMELVRNPVKLLNIDISVRRNSAYRERLENLEEELGGDIRVNYLPGNLSTDRIIQMVSEGDIEYTISDKNIADITASYYQNLDINTIVGIMQQVAWSTRKTSPELLSAVNSWLEMERTGSDFFVIYNKYYNNERAFRERAKSDYYSLEGSNISEYDNLIKSTAQKINWDWLFLASQIYQESEFDPERKSWAGAIGLMQVMPKTAREYGVNRLTNPQSNLKAGIAHLQYLNEYWTEHIPDSTERLKFVLASYNAGHNHVQDARRLAEKYDLDPDVWYENVEKTIQWKSQKKYYSDPVVYYGFCRGEEPMNYVREIFGRYEYYTEFFELNSDQNATASL